jgi:hypothetical protein
MKTQKLISLRGLATLTLLVPVGCGGDTSVDPDCSATLHADADGDGYGDPAVTESACVGDGFVDNADDCDDADARVHPDAAEECDDVDNDCSGTVDDDVAVGTWYPDDDGDQFGAREGSVDACARPDGFVSSDTDCDDDDPGVNPDAVEIVGDGIDNDCLHEPLPAVVDATTMHVAAYDGAGPDSFLSQACAGTSDAGEPVITILAESDGFVATSPFTRGDFNVLQLDQVVLSDEIEGGLNLFCAPDLGSSTASEIVVGSPDSSSVQLVYGDTHGTSAMFSDDDTGLGYALAVLQGKLVFGAGHTETVILVRHEVEAGSSYSGHDVSNLFVDLTAPLRSLDATRDLTGDGVDDLVVGSAGQVMVIDGDDMLGDDDEARGSLTLTSDDDSFGTKVLAIPDATGDGVSDLLVSAPDAGTVYLIPGQTYGVYPVEQAALMTFSGGQGAGVSMAAIEAAGDGTPGFAIGMPETDQVLLYRSGDVVTFPAGAYELDQSTASTVIEGEGGTGFGTTITAGDLTMDGAIELMIGAPSSDGDRGRVYVISTQR